jgi:putative tricarboxylic transport membrane protein
VSEPLAAGGDAGPGWRALSAIGIALLLVALAVWLDSQRLPAPPVVGVGPSAAMKLVSAMVAILGVAHLVAAWRARAVPGARPEYGDVRALAWVLAALVGLVLLLELGGGFVAAATWLFAATARGFGAKFSPKSVGFGLALSLAVYLFFTRALSLGLPSGPLERLLG